MSVITPSLHLVCRACGWKPDAKQTMGEVKDHMVFAHNEQVNEDGSIDAKMDLAAYCVCGKEMRPSHTTKHGPMLHDHFKCDVCGNQGYVRRKAA